MIECIRTYRLSCPLPEILGYAQGRFGSRQALLVQIITDDGLEGWGECSGFAAVTQTAITTILAPHLIGKDPYQTELIWNNLWRLSRDWARRGSVIGALSGIDMALWDLKGKKLNQSLSEMLGGRYRERIPCYATGCYFRDLPEADLIPSLIEEAREYAETGFRAIKVQIGRTLPFDRALIRTLRQALPDTFLMANAHQAYDLPEAILIGTVLEEYRFTLFDDPLSLDAPAAYRRLGDKLDLPISAGKREQTRWGFQSLLDTEGLQYLSPDIAYCGGISEVLKIRATAAARGVNIHLHVNGTMFALAAGLHVLASDFRQPGRSEAGVGYLEYEAPDAHPLRDALFKSTVPIEYGTAQVPNGPGLGVELDLDLLRIFTMDKQEVRTP